MIQLFKMALRNLGRNRRRSFFSALALGMGLALLLLMASFVEGEIRGSMNLAIKLQSGHLQVRARTYDENKTSLAWEDLVENPEQVAAQIAALPPVQAATPRLYASGIAAAGNDTAGVRIVGIDPASAANAPFRDGVIGGAFLDAGDREGVLVGKALADKLGGLQPGASIRLLVNTSNGDVGEQTFTIRGVYSTRTPSFDESMIFMPLAKAQAIVGAGNRASTVFVLLKDIDQTTAVTAALQPGQQYQVMTYAQMNEMLMQTEQLAGSYMIMLYLIVLAITATVIVNTLVMAVFERTREIGILSAMGMKAGRITALFLAESILLAAGGIAIGLALGAVLVGYASVVGFTIGNFGVSGILLGETIYARLTVNDAVTLIILSFVVTLLAALYPALMAARLEPVDALRGGEKA